MKRRTFLASTATAALATQLPSLNAMTSSPTTSVHLFSKHLQFLDYRAMAASAAAMGFDGVDLTVRPRGHVEPADAAQVLPEVARILRDEGLPPVMCTTGFTSPEDDHFDATMEAIAAAGFRHLRMGYYRFTPRDDPAARLDQLQDTVEQLAEALADYGLNGALQNHAGERNVGSSLWEYQQLLEGIDPSALGIQFDIRHATAERGASWIRDLEVALPHISSLVFKDFRWEVDAATGRPEIVNVPLGEGWVDFGRYLERLDGLHQRVPHTLHCEYNLGGAEHGDRKISWPQEKVEAAIKRDLDILREWQAAS
mgnify:CR=1 FL=1